MLFSVILCEVHVLSAGFGAGRYLCVPSLCARCCCLCCIGLTARSAVDCVATHSLAQAGRFTRQGSLTITSSDIVVKGCICRTHVFFFFGLAPRSRATCSPSRRRPCGTKTTWATCSSARPGKDETSSSSTRGRSSCTRTHGPARTLPSTGWCTSRWVAVVFVGPVLFFFSFFFSSGSLSCLGFVLRLCTAPLPPHALSHLARASCTMVILYLPALLSCCRRLLFVLLGEGERSANVVGFHLLCWRVRV